MNNRNFMTELAIALLLSIAGATAWQWIPLDSSIALLRLITTTLCSIYLIWMLTRSPRRAGRVSAGMIALSAIWLCWLLEPGLPLHLFIQLSTIWLLRALSVHDGLPAIALDLGLCGSSLGLSVWALHKTGSLFAALWCFFLIQAGHTLLANRSPERSIEASTDTFERAFCVAEAAMRRLADPR